LETLVNVIGERKGDRKGWAKKYQTNHQNHHWGENNKSASVKKTLP